MAGKDLKHKPQNIDESLRQKYMKMISALSTDEFGKVKHNKYKYKSMVKSETLELLPEASDEPADETAQYISNLLTHEAQREKTTAAFTYYYDPAFTYYYDPVILRNAFNSGSCA